jgi:hypothetical protein
MYIWPTSKKKISRQAGTKVRRINELINRLETVVPYNKGTVL